MTDRERPSNLRPSVYGWGLIGVPAVSGWIGMAAAENDCDTGDCDLTALAFPFFAILAFVVMAAALVAGEIVLWFARRFPSHR